MTGSLILSGNSTKNGKTRKEKGLERIELTREEKQCIIN